MNYHAPFFAEEIRDERFAAADAAGDSDDGFAVEQVLAIVVERPDRYVNNP